MVEEKYEYGNLIARENRFIARVDLAGVEERVHVPNTGRLPQLMSEGLKVQLRKSDNPNRKTNYSLIAVKNDQHWINIDSQLPNRLAFESIEEGIIKEFTELDQLKREVTFGNSRFDLYYEKGDRKGFIEIKGVTYAEDGTGMFPDAPTERGTKHIYELMKAVEAGFEASILFLMMREDCVRFRPYREIDVAFSEALNVAANHGVQILAYQTIYNGTVPTVTKQAPVELS